jgi:hypothetical protein
MYSGIARPLALTAGGYAHDLRDQLITFVRFLLLHLAVRDWLIFVAGANDTRLCLASGFTACLVASLIDPGRLGAILGVATALATWKLMWSFPQPSNHFAIEYLCLLLLCTLRISRPGERALLVDTLRWLVAWMFLAAGIQKMLYGTYFSGSLLATLLAEDRFAFLFRHVLPADELAALGNPAFTGPYHLRSLAGLAVSNAVYLLEITAALLLFSRRGRQFGVTMAFALLVAIEAGAREVMFGLLVAALLTLYLGNTATRGMLAVGAGAYAILLATKLGVLPYWYFN